MNALYVFLSLLFGINLFGFSNTARQHDGFTQMKDTQITNDRAGNSIINANPGTVVVLDDTHFSPPR